MLTGRLTRIEPRERRAIRRSWYARFAARAGEPVVRLALRQAMKVMAEQFVHGPHDRRGAREKPRQRDECALSPLLRHAGRSGIDAGRRRALLRRLRDAIDAIGASGGSGRNARCSRSPSISIKLSALHPRYEYRAARARVRRAACPRSAALARRARASIGIGMTIDAEESERLELSLGDLRAAAPRTGARGLGRARARGAGLPEARAARSSTGSSRSRATPSTASRCAWSRARTGTARSSARRCRAWPAIRCSRARRTPTSPTWRARARCSRRATRSTRCSRRTTRTRSRGCRRMRERLGNAGIRVPAPARHGRERSTRR